MVRWVVGSILHGVDPLSYFSFQPVLHDWCNKGRGMCYPVCGMVHIKEPLLLIDKSNLCGGSVFPFSLSEWSLTICLTPYNRRQNVLSASLNKTFLSLSCQSNCTAVYGFTRAGAIAREYNCWRRQTPILLINCLTFNVNNISRYLQVLIHTSRSVFNSRL